MFGGALVVHMDDRSRSYVEGDGAGRFRVAKHAEPWWCVEYK